MSNQIIPVSFPEIDKNIYAGFWSRLVAMLIDSFLLMPFTLIIASIKATSDETFNVINLSFMLFYNVYLVKKDGATPGKYLAGIKIIRLDSGPIGWKEAILRYSVDFIPTIIGVVILYVNNESKTSNMWVLYFWLITELVVLLTNKRKRAVHDFIAGTVVVKRKYVSKIQEFMNEKSL